MERFIKEIWNVFKSSEKEMMCLFYLHDEKLHHVKISKNETANSGELNLKKIIDIASDLTGKKVMAIHNHPFDKPNPSFPDFFQCDYLMAMLRLLGIKLIDFGIVSPYGFFSFAKQGLLKNDDFIPCTAQNAMIKEIDFPKIVLSSDIDENMESIKEALSEHKEIIVNNHISFGSDFFSGTFLLQNESQLFSKNLFFYRCDEDLNISPRIKDIHRVLEPFEMYALYENKFIPLKKYGYV